LEFIDFFSKQGENRRNVVHFLIGEGTSDIIIMKSIIALKERPRLSLKNTLKFDP